METSGPGAHFNANAQYCRLRLRCRTVLTVVSKPNFMTVQRYVLRHTTILVFYSVAAIGFLLLSFGSSQAQALTARISILSPAKIKVEGNYPNGSARWPFRNTYGRVVGLGDRIQSLLLTTSNGTSVPLRKAAPGEFAADSLATAFTYEVSLAPPPNPADGAHISWLTEQHGFLMLADLLPDLQANAVRVEFSLPRSWGIASSAAKSPQGGYELLEKDNAVFFVGGDLKEKRKRIGSTDFTLVTAGEWQFSRETATEKMARIIRDQREHTGLDLKRPVTVMLVPFPDGAGAERWSAETRGSNVVLLASGNPTARFSLSQLSVVLCHELFHLWVPNALSFDGDYDWFFEGFTLYQALVTAVRLGLIDFQEYLDTLGRVYDSYQRVGERDGLSLIEASRRRWTSGSTLVYDKGMLVAFLYDLRLRKASRNRRTLDDLYRELFRRFPAGAKRVDGNEAIFPILVQQDGGDEKFVRSYIQSPGSIDFGGALSPYGIRVVDSGHQKRLMVADGIGDEQRELLVALGYRKRRR